MRAACAVLGVVAWGCAPPCGERTSLRPAPHRQQLTWDALGPSGRVEHTIDGEAQPPLEAARVDGQHEVVLSGLPPLVSIAYTLWSGEQEICSDSWLNPPMSAGLPLLSVSGAEEGGWSRLVGSLMGSSNTLFVLDRQGRYRWHHLVADPGVAVTTGIPTEAGVRYGVLDEHRQRDIGTVRLQSWGGEPGAERETPGAHHTFEVLPDGTIAYLAVSIRPWTDPDTGEQEDVVGDALWELAPDGSLREVFDLWDHEQPVPHDSWDSGFYPQGIDWSHGNGLSYSLERDSYLISFGHLDRIYEIDRPGGALIQRIDAAAWSIEGHRFAFPHAPSWVGPDRLLLFSYADGQAGAVEYTVDEGSESLREEWSWLAEEEEVTFLGQAARLAGGETLVNFGASGRVVEVADGAVVWSMETPLGVWAGSVRSGDGLAP